MGKKIRKTRSPTKGDPEPVATEDTTEASLDEVRQQRETLPFPVVGIGASAGGVEALTQLLRSLATDTGMAFVIVPHLDPTHSSSLSEILSRSTKMPIGQVEDRMAVEPDRVYVIPPGTVMEIERGALLLSPRRSERGIPRPIDQFFRSLAADQRHKSIGVILSGTANDGTLGLSAIKAEGGITFAQDDTAQHKSMPRSAIAEGCVDFVLPPDEIAKELERVASHPFVGSPAQEAIDDSPRETNLSRILEHLRVGTGVDFSNYKRNTLYRRIIRRAVLHKIGTLKDYARFLQGNLVEVEALYRDILINVTSFFRNPEAYEILKARVFPLLTKERSANESVRIWVLGCSTGQEAYSIAIAFAEYAETSGRNVRVQVFATDLNGSGVEKARAGVFSKTIAQDLSPERLRRFFVDVDGTYRIRKEIRDVCVFARHNVLTEPPFSRMDLISCRNLLIYMEPSAQQRILPTLHYALQPAGFLWLGSSETIGPFRDLFDLEDSKQKVYSKKPGSRRLAPYPAESGFTPDPRGSLRATTRQRSREAGGVGIDAPKEADRILLTRFAPPSVLVSADLEILQFRGDTGPYLAPMPGKASLNLLKMLREGLLEAVRAAVEKAKREETPVEAKGLRVKKEGGDLDLDLSVIPIKGRDGGEATFLVLFEEVTDSATAAPRKLRPDADTVSPAHETEREIERLKQEVAATREYLQSVIEQQEGANEELQSANEEVQSSNEELQSINEELETSKEEIESSNEELATVNEELHNRNLEINQSNNDLLNLLGSVQLAIVMLGPELRIRRFTPLAEKMLNLVPADVGRSIGDIKLHLDLPNLERDLKEVIDTMTLKETEVLDRSGRWHLLRLRPYRTLENKIDGAVIVLDDVDTLKRSEEALRHHTELLEQTHEPILMWGLDGTLAYWNRGAEEVYGYTREHALGRKKQELLGSSVDPLVHRDALEKSARWSGEMEYKCNDGSQIVVESRLVLMREADGHALVLETDNPITERKRLEQATMQRSNELIAADRSKNEFLAMLAHELRNPLATLRNSVHLVKRPDLDEEMVLNVHGMMERQVQNMARMVDDLLDVSRITQGKVRLKRSSVRLADTLRSAVEVHRAVLEARDQEMSLSLPADDVWVVGDELRLEQIFSNLIHNASKFTQRGGHLWLSAAIPDGGGKPAADGGSKNTASVEIRVRDDGIGIDPDILPRVFDLFQQADQSLDRTQGGLGIGLTLARYLVELHGGSIEARSDGLSSGSEFVVRLPVLHEVELSRRKAATKESRRSPVRPRRILVVDDNVDSADSLTLLLRHTGHTVEVAYDGSRALELADAFEPEVAFLDIGLPGMNGYDLAQQLRSKRALKKMLLIALSGYGREDDQRRARDAGFDHHLTKPADFEDVQDLLAK